jgi:hypothetical protein
MYDGAPDTAKMASPDLLTQDDSQSITVTVDNPDQVHYRIYEQPLSSTSTTVPLPPQLDQFRFEPEGHQITTSWTTFYDADTIEISIEQLSQDHTYAWDDQLRTTQAYLAALGATKITLDEDIPGFPAGSQIDFAQPLINTVYAQWTTAPSYGMSRYKVGAPSTRTTPATGSPGRSRLHRGTPRGWPNP